MTPGERISGGILGAVTGDALGIPVAFKDRGVLQANPVKEMRGYGTHNQPPGTWSDDSSLILCGTESLQECGYDLKDMGRRFVSWFDGGLWRPYGQVFDIGGTTSIAMSNLAAGEPPEECGGCNERDTGNGSLMRILPVALFTSGNTADVQMGLICRASRLTHAHPRCQIACAFYGLFVRALYKGVSPGTSYEYALKTIEPLFESADFSPEKIHFSGLLSGDLADKSESEISSSGYVVDTLAAAIWCLLTTGNFQDCVLKAVNLGGDTDTTASVTGGLAGVHYGMKAISEEWLHSLARYERITDLCARFAEKVATETHH